MYLEKLTSTEQELADSRQQLERVQDEAAMVEKEYKKLQEKHRDVLQNEYNL